MNDVEQTSSKQKFGYFSMPPSAFAGNTTFEQKQGISIFYSSLKELKWKSKNRRKKHIFWIMR